MVMPVNVPQVAVKGLEEAITSKNCIKLQLRLEETTWPPPSQPSVLWAVVSGRGEGEDFNCLN